MKSSAVCIWRAFLKWVPNECINEAWPSLDGLHPRPRECDPRSRVHNHTYLSELPRCLHVRVFESHVVPHGRRGFSFIPHRGFLIPLLFFFTLTRSKWTSPAYRPWVQTRLGRERALTARRARQNEHVTRRRARVSAEGPPKTLPQRKILISVGIILASNDWNFLDTFSTSSQSSPFTARARSQAHARTPLGPCLRSVPTVPCLRWESRARSRARR